tara:strand:+ start:624 stop:725 length:102 start_codon:yes stop_codon:yes gene_type:complete
MIDMDNCRVCGKSLALRIETDEEDICCRWVVMR